MAGIISSMNTIYCPYLGREIPLSSATKEHIIPLSLGGANSFTIMVDREFNSRMGTEIDGALANDFMVIMKRQEFNAVGHSKKRPVAISKKSKMTETGQSVQVSLDRKSGMAIWNPVEKRYLSDQETAGKQFSMNFVIGRWNRLRFAAKVALATGYFLYNDIFVKDVNHDEIRTIMNMLNADDDQWSESIQTRVYDQFSGPEEKDGTAFYALKLLCKFVNGSCVLIIPGPRNINFTVGVLGQFVGTLNVPAETKNLPKGDDHDLGHAIVLQNGKIFRMSYRSLVSRAYESFEEMVKN